MLCTLCVCVNLYQLSILSSLLFFEIVNNNMLFTIPQLHVIEYCSFRISSVPGMLLQSLGLPGPCLQGRFQCYHWERRELGWGGGLGFRAAASEASSPPCSPAAGEPFQHRSRPRRGGRPLSPHPPAVGATLVMGVTVGKVTLQEPVVNKDPWKKDLGCAPQQPLLPMYYSFHTVSEFT